MTDEEFLKKLEKCTAGYNFWKGIVNKYKLSAKDYVIAFPHEKDPVNECGIVHLKQFMEYGEKKDIDIMCRKRSGENTGFQNGRYIHKNRSLDKRRDGVSYYSLLY